MRGIHKLMLGLGHPRIILTPLFFLLIFFCSCSQRTYSYQVSNEIKTTKVKRELPRKMIAITMICFFIGLGSTTYMIR